MTEEKIKRLSQMLANNLDPMVARELKREIDRSNLEGLNNEYLDIKLIDFPCIHKIGSSYTIDEDNLYLTLYPDMPPKIIGLVTTNSSTCFNNLDPRSYRGLNGIYSTTQPRKLPLKEGMYYTLKMFESTPVNKPPYECFTKAGLQKCADDISSQLNTTEEYLLDFYVYSVKSIAIKIDDPRFSDKTIIKLNRIMENSGKAFYYADNTGKYIAMRFDKSTNINLNSCLMRLHF